MGVAMVGENPFLHAFERVGEQVTQIETHLNRRLLMCEACRGLDQQLLADLVQVGGMSQWSEVLRALVNARREVGK